MSPWITQRMHRRDQTVSNPFSSTKRPKAPMVIGSFWRKVGTAKLREPLHIAPRIDHLHPGGVKLYCFFQPHRLCASETQITRSKILYASFNIDRKRLVSGTFKLLPFFRVAMLYNNELGGRDYETPANIEMAVFSSLRRNAQRLPPHQTLAR